MEIENYYISNILYNTYMAQSHKVRLPVPGWTADISMKQPEKKYRVFNDSRSYVPRLLLQSNGCASICAPCVNCLSKRDVRYCSQICEPCWTCDPLPYRDNSMLRRQIILGKRASKMQR